MKRSLVLSGLAVVILVAAALRITHLDVLLWKSWTLNRQTMPETALDLGRYRADIQAKVVEGLEQELSALTYNADRDSLFAILNDPPLLVEISLEGELLRTIRIEGVNDVEGLEHLGGTLFAIAEERSRRLLLADLPDAAEGISADRMQTLTLELNGEGNKGLEGLAWDAEGRRLLVVKERDPMRLIAVHGFAGQDLSRPQQLRIEDLQVEEGGLFMRDLSSLSWIHQSGHLLLLSDQSNMLVEYDPALRPISIMGLWPGFSGLTGRVPQAEGVAVDSQKRIYIVSEPNLFYRFAPR